MSTPFAAKPPTTAESNVESIDSRRDARARKTSRTSQLFTQVRELLCDRLEGALPRALDQVDDALYDLADKAETSELQTRYFDAMRVLRIKRPEMLDGFRAELEQAIDNRLRDQQSADDPFSLPAIESFTLSLVEDEDLEESIAVTNMSSRIRDRCHEQIFALDRRLALLLARPELEGDDNPLGPEVISAAASGVTRLLDVAIDIRLVLLKLIERHLLQAAEAAYEAINRELARQGVLTNLRQEVAVNRAAGRPAPATEGQAAAADPTSATAAGVSHQAASAAYPGSSGAGVPLPQGSFTGHAGVPGAAYAPAISSGQPAAGNWPAAAGIPLAPSAPSSATESASGPLLHGDVVAGSMPVSGLAHHHQQMLFALEQALRNGTVNLPGVATEEAGAASDHANGEASGGPRVAQHYLPVLHHAVGELTALQRGVVGELGGDGATIDMGGLALGATNVIHEIKSTEIARDLNGPDSLMIDVVAMMFDLILDDANIANPIRALIGRLQIPVLKVALVDKTFFSRKTHPARQLLNKLAESGLGWGPSVEEDDPQYQFMEALIGDLLEQFDDEVQIFSEMLKRLEAFLAREKASLEDSNWEMTRIAEQRARLAQAREQARGLVQGVLDANDLPEPIVSFLGEEWQQLLLSRLFQEGESSPGYQEALGCMHDLVWSITVEPSVESRRRLGELLPFLLQRLKNGLTALRVSKPRRDEFFRTLSRIHLEAIRPPELREAAAADGGGTDLATDAQCHLLQTPAAASEADTASSAADSAAGDTLDLDAGQSLLEIAQQPAQVPAPEQPGAQPPAAESNERPASPVERALEDEARMQHAIEQANKAVFETAAARVQCQ
ncbi:MAG: DUF1631 domain-containing protein, partial [Gammaproteobacteria bacterium]|nr:DUF1631 domain-containing protein [Gammaproteobacteria bacterium]